MSVSPKISRLSWGEVTVEGRSYKDAKLFPGGSREWNWRETGTEHVPGIQPSDVQELLDHGATIIILSQGMQQRLQISKETIELLQGLGMEMKICPTEEAVKVQRPR
jgi:hypothetical protein